MLSKSAKVHSMSLDYFFSFDFEGIIYRWHFDGKFSHKTHHFISWTKMN